MKSTITSRALLCLAALSVSPAWCATSPPAVKTDAGYIVNGALFTSTISVDFTKSTMLDSNFIIGTDTIQQENVPYSRTHKAENVKLNADDSLSLLVPGVKTVVNNDIPGAEIYTAYGDILYGSVRVVAKASPVAGTCHGMFFFASDNQETDIEILTYQPQNLYFTNQATIKDTPATSKVWPAPSTMNSEYHEYRIDWLDGSTDFWIDGEYQLTLTENVASKPSHFLLNNWSNGDPNWSAGPPTELNDFRIKSVVAYWNRTGTATPSKRARSVRL